MNEKNASATKTTEKVGGHGYALLEGVLEAKAAKAVTNEHFSEIHL